MRYGSTLSGFSLSLNCQTQDFNITYPCKSIAFYNYVILLFSVRSIEIAEFIFQRLSESSNSFYSVTMSRSTIHR